MDYIVEVMRIGIKMIYGGFAFMIGGVSLYGLWTSFKWFLRLDMWGGLAMLAMTSIPIGVFLILLSIILS